VVHHDVAGRGVERDDLAVAGRGQRVDVGDVGADRARDRVVGDEQVRPVRRVPPVRPARVADRAGVRGHDVERAPRGREVGTLDVEVAEILVPPRGRVGAGLLDEQAVLVEPQRGCVEERRDEARQVARARERAELGLVAPVVDARGEPARLGRRERRELGGRVRPQRGLHRVRQRRERARVERGAQAHDTVGGEGGTLGVGDLAHVSPSLRSAARGAGA
jgi:hypothetical protein